jgi:hypothetical protein
MDTTQVVILIVAIVVVAAGVYLAVRMRNSRRLREKFGPEYDRTLQSEGNRLRAEDNLAKREKRVKRYQIHPLLTAQCRRFQESWREIQARFVDDPKTAVDEADRLVQQVMTARGYPVEDFEQCAADISVDHPLVVDNYRAGHDVVRRHARGQATTEDLRRAMIHYRTLFDDLLEELPVEAEPVKVRRAS